MTAIKWDMTYFKFLLPTNSSSITMSSHESMKVLGMTVMLISGGTTIKWFTFLCSIFFLGCSSTSNFVEFVLFDKASKRFDIPNFLQRDFIAKLFSHESSVSRRHLLTAPFVVAFVEDPPNCVTGKWLSHFHLSFNQFIETSQKSNNPVFEICTCHEGN